MSFAKTMDKATGPLLVAIVIFMCGLFWAEITSYASDDALKEEREARIAADVELKQAQTDLTKEVSKYIRTQERRDGKVDTLLDRLEKHMDKEGG